MGSNLTSNAGNSNGSLRSSSQDELRWSDPNEYLIFKAEKLSIGDPRIPSLATLASPGQEHSLDRMELIMKTNGAVRSLAREISLVEFFAVRLGLTAKVAEGPGVANDMYAFFAKDGSLSIRLEGIEA